MREAARFPRVESVLDLGAGVGAVGLSMLALDLAEQVTLVERDPEAAALLRENAAPFGKRASVIESDVRDVRVRADLTMLNPPYFHPHRGRGAPEPRRREARRGELEPFLAAASKASRRTLVVYPSEALDELVSASTAQALTIEELRFVHGVETSNARVVLVRFGDAMQLDVLPPWSERNRFGTPNVDLEAFLRSGKLSDRADDRG